MFAGQTLSGLSHKHTVHVRRTPERLAGRGQVSGTVAGVGGHDVRDETSGELEIGNYKLFFFLTRNFSARS